MLGAFARMLGVFALMLGAFALMLGAFALMLGAFALMLGAFALMLGAFAPSTTAVKESHIAASCTRTIMSSGLVTHCDSGSNPYQLPLRPRPHSLATVMRAS